MYWCESVLGLHDYMMKPKKTDQIQKDRIKIILIDMQMVRSRFKLINVIQMISNV
jgi:hypothetical protein